MGCVPCITGDFSEGQLSRVLPTTEEGEGREEVGGEGEGDETMVRRDHTTSGCLTECLCEMCGDLHTCRWVAHPG